MFQYLIDSIAPIFPWSNFKTIPFWMYAASSFSKFGKFFLVAIAKWYIDWNNIKKMEPPRWCKESKDAPLQKQVFALWNVYWTHTEQNRIKLCCFQLSSNVTTAWTGQNSHLAIYSTKHVIYFVHIKYIRMEKNWGETHLGATNCRTVI